MRTHREERIDAPVVLVKWYDWTKWLLERVDSFPKNQRFVFGTRLADRALRVLEILVDASYRNCYILVRVSISPGTLFSQADVSAFVPPARDVSSGVIGACYGKQETEDGNLPK